MSVDNGRVKAIVIVPVGAVLLLALAGCVPQPVGPSGAPTNATRTPSSTATAEPGPTATADAGATPITFGCDEFVTPQEMYDYNSIFAKVDGSPAAGTAAAQAVAIGGIACRWVNTSSGLTIDFSVATPGPAGLESLRAGLAGTEAAAFDGYFADGTAQAFVGPYWVAVSSDEFVSDQDAAPLIEIAVNALP